MGRTSELVSARKFFGLCLYCGADAKGKSRCYGCIKKNSAFSSRRRKNCSLSGACWRCGREKENISASMCDACLEKDSLREKSIRDEAVKCIGDSCEECGRKDGLSIDHRFNDGNEDRLKGKRHRDSSARRIILDASIRYRFRILCMGCNIKKVHYHARHYGSYLEALYPLAAPPATLFPFLRNAMRKIPDLKAVLLEQAGEPDCDPAVAEWLRRLAEGDSYSSEQAKAAKVTHSEELGQ